MFPTGGTSLGPVVRRFTDRFGADRVAGGAEFVSVAEGSALIGRDRGVVRARDEGSGSPDGGGRSVRRTA